MSVKFTQYLMPDGRKVPNSIDRPEVIEKKAESIISRGLSFECEMLTTGQISLTVSDGQQDIDIEVCQNGPEVPISVDRMIERVHSKYIK